MPCSYPPCRHVSSWAETKYGCILQIFCRGTLEPRSSAARHWDRPPAKTETPARSSRASDEERGNRCGAWVGGRTLWRDAANEARLSGARNPWKCGAPPRTPPPFPLSSLFVSPATRTSTHGCPHFGRILGLPARLPRHLRDAGDGEGRRRGESAGRPLAPVHRRIAVHQGQPLHRAHLCARPPAASAQAHRAEGQRRIQAHRLGRGAG